MTLCVTDLDGTLVFTGAPGPGLRQVEKYTSGRVSLIHERAWEMLTELGRSDRILIVTSRTVEQFHRAALPPVSWVLASNGLDLIDHGRVRAGWRAEVTEEMSRVARSWLSVEPSCAKSLALSGVAVAVTDTYLAIGVGTHRSIAACERELAPVLAEVDWLAHGVGRKLYLLPRAMDKKPGVERFMRGLESSGYLAAGDSMLDRDMLAGASAAITPRGSQLSGLEIERLQVTHEGGPGAGAEIMDWFRVSVL